MRYYTSLSQYDYGWMRNNISNVGTASQMYYGPPHSHWFPVFAAAALYWLWRAILVVGLGMGVAYG